MDQRQLEILSQHPGGFDRDFFETHLPTAVGQWMDEHGVAALAIHLRDGRELEDVSAVQTALTWACFFTRDGGMEFVPHREVASVRVYRRPGPAGEAERAPIGFSRVEESAD